MEWFFRDFQYRRSYELGALPIKAELIKTLERLPIWLNRFLHRPRHSHSSLLEEYWYGQFIHETEFAWIPTLNDLLLNRNTWITGYWQSPLYFSEHSKLICTELMPPQPRNHFFILMAKLIKERESVALGVRLYEESKEPNAHASDGKLKSPTHIRAAIERIRTLRPLSQFFVFCTHRSPFLDELALPDDSIYITHDDGFVGSHETLWLLSQCRHHIFTNSSFYWWGAWLSGRNLGDQDQIILAADNFINRDGLCSEWETF